jgi:hypothetical protein
MGLDPVIDIVEEVIAELYQTHLPVVSRGAYIIGTEYPLSMLVDPSHHQFPVSDREHEIPLYDLISSEQECVDSLLFYRIADSGELIRVK